jgi:hypothetical protein
MYLFSDVQTIALPISCKLVNQTVLQTSLENVLSLRLREGYTVKRVQIQQGLLDFVCSLFYFNMNTFLLLKCFHRI